jgi:nucleotide-binding universal stress UspA family protein
MIALKHVLVATDFSVPSDVAVTYGRALARGFHARLSLLHVVDDVQARAVTAALTETYVEDLGSVQSGLEAEAKERLSGLLSDEDRRELGARAFCVTSGAIADEIVRFGDASDADLLVLGTRGRRGLGHVFLGSVAERVVRLAACPVLTVRHPEHEFVLPDALQTVAHQ